MCVPGKVNVKDEELDEMLNEGKGPINFTVFLTLFGEKLNGERFLQIKCLWIFFDQLLEDSQQHFSSLQAPILKTPYSLPSNFLTPMGRALSIRRSKTNHINSCFSYFQY